MTAESEFTLWHAEIFQAGFDTQPSVWWVPTFLSSAVTWPGQEADHGHFSKAEG
jgi:hypothetical protein